MVQGINTNVEFRGRIFHIQSEDCGHPKRMIKSLVFENGEVMTTVETSYAKLARSPDFEKEVTRRLTVQHWKVVADLQRGALYVNGEGPREAQVDRRGCADRRSDSKQDTRDKPQVESDRRISMLTMCLAVVGVMLTFLVVRGVTSVSDTAADPPATSALLERVPVTSSQAPPLVDSSAEPPVVGMRQGDDVPPTALQPRPAPDRTQARVTSRPPIRVKRPAPVVTPAAPPTVAPPSPPVVAAVNVSSDALNGNSATAIRVALRKAPRPEPPSPVTLGDLVELAAVDVPPKPTSRELPSYTKRAKRKKQQGTVEMHLLINERGVVSDLRLKRTIPDSDLNDVTINTVLHWRFDPARVADVAVRTWKPVSIVYSIESGQTRVALLE